LWIEYDVEYFPYRKTVLQPQKWNWKLRYKRSNTKNLNAYTLKIITVIITWQLLLFNRQNKPTTKNMHDQWEVDWRKLTLTLILQRLPMNSEGSNKMYLTYVYDVMIHINYINRRTGSIKEKVSATQLSRAEPSFHFFIFPETRLIVA
jgi:hypothetical protein